MDIEDCMEGMEMVVTKELVDVSVCKEFVSY